VNIDLVVRRNDQGRIYGITFIDHNERCVFNGSRLGKEFSANVFNDRLGGMLREVTGLQKTVQPDDTSQIEKTTASDIGDAVSGLLAFQSPELAGNPDENNRLSKKKRMKKRRYGRQDGSSSLIN
jgi:hypothetical protein